MKEDKEKNSEKSKNGTKISFIKKPKNIIIFIIIIILLITGGLFAYNHFSNLLSEDEKMVAKVVKSYHDNLKNPSSMQIFEIRIYDNANKDGKIILMDTSGQNGFGWNTRDIVAYTYEAKYMGDDSEANRTISKYTDTSDKVEIMISRGIQTKWKDNKDYISVDKDKVLKNYDKVK